MTSSVYHAHILASDIYTVPEHTGATTVTAVDKKKFKEIKRNKKKRETHTERINTFSCVCERERESSHTANIFGLILYLVCVFL